MAIDGLRLVTHGPGRVRIRLSRAAMLYAHAGLIRLRRIPSVKAALIIMNEQALEIEYDAESRSTEQFLSEIAQELGLQIDAALLVSGISEYSETAARTLPLKAPCLPRNRRLSYAPPVASPWDPVQTAALAWQSRHAD